MFHLPFQIDTFRKMRTYYRGRTKSSPICFSFIFMAFAVFLFFCCCSSFFFCRSVCCNSGFLNQIHSLGCQHICTQIFHLDALFHVIRSHVVLFCQTSNFCFQVFVRNFQLFQFCDLFQSQTQLYFVLCTFQISFLQ